MPSGEPSPDVMRDTPAVRPGSSLAWCLDTLDGGGGSNTLIQ